MQMRLMFEGADGVIELIDVAATLEQQDCGDCGVKEAKLDSVGSHVEHNGTVRSGNTSEKGGVAAAPGIQLVVY